MTYLSGLFQQACLLCTQNSNTLLCHTCADDALTSLYETEIPNMYKHAELKSIAERVPINQIFALGWYKWPLNDLVQQFKFRHCMGVVPILSEWFVKSALTSNVALPDAVLALPMPLGRLFLRGFNQSAILAQEIANQLELVDLSHLSKRRHSWQSQRTLGRQSRLRRKQHFSVKPIDSNIKHIAIVDDVLTTGATVSAFANAIKRNHPHITIDVWVIAVTPNTKPY